MKRLKKEVRQQEEEQLKTAKVTARRGAVRQQMAGLAHISRLLKEMDHAEEKEMAFAYAGIATGYVNAMCELSLIDGKELQDIIGVIEQTGERAVARIEMEKRPLIWRAVRRGLKA